MKVLGRGGLTLSALAVLMVAVGVTTATGGIKPIDLSIAKDKSGPYKSPGLHVENVGDNPQIQKAKIKPGKSAKFYIRITNKNNSSLGDYFGGDPSTSDFELSYSLKGEGDITGDVSGDCVFMEVPAKDKLQVTLTIERTESADKGDAEIFGVVLADNTGCTGQDDLALASVKAK